MGFWMRIEIEATPEERWATMCLLSRSHDGVRAAGSPAPTDPNELYKMWLARIRALYRSGSAAPRGAWPASADRNGSGVPAGKPSQRPKGV